MRNLFNFIYLFIATTTTTINNNSNNFCVVKYFLNVFIFNIFSWLIYFLLRSVNDSSMVFLYSSILLCAGYWSVFISHTGRLGSSLPRYCPSNRGEFHWEFLLTPDTPALTTHFYFLLCFFFLIVAGRSSAPDTSWKHWGKQDMTSRPCSYVEDSVRTLCSSGCMPTSRVRALKHRVRENTDQQITLCWL